MRLTELINKVLSKRARCAVLSVHTNDDLNTGGILLGKRRERRSTILDNVARKLR
ncbi:MAG: hypothetical protein AB9869_02090 [Verrucomicrobiia bacterium]